MLDIYLIINEFETSAEFSAGGLSSLNHEYELRDQQGRDV
jgi:hypothetical protein